MYGFVVRLNRSENISVLKSLWVYFVYLLHEVENLLLLKSSINSCGIVRLDRTLLVISATQHNITQHIDIFDIMSALSFLHAMLTMSFLNAQNKNSVCFLQIAPLNRSYSFCPKEAMVACMTQTDAPLDNKLI